MQRIVAVANRSRDTGDADRHGVAAFAADAASPAMAAVGELAARVVAATV